jgi:DNA adenine methylase
MLQSSFTFLKKNIRNERLSPVIKWAGGKEAELKHILPRIPDHFERYFEPFVGGGAVYFALDCLEFFINDKSSELMTLYELIKQDDEQLYSSLFKINDNWRLLERIVENNRDRFMLIYEISRPTQVTVLQIKDWVTEFVIQHVEDFNSILSTSFNLDIENFIHEVIRNLTNKLARMREIERRKGLLSYSDILDNVESALKSAFYMHFRHLYNKSSAYGINKSFGTAIFYFVREFCYAAMFRYNRRGEFNVPYGGIQYNRKDFRKKISAMRSKAYREQFKKTRLYCLDFEEFLNNRRPSVNDFIFVDPPYDSDFSTYTKNTFGHEEHIRLAMYLLNCPAHFMLVIKNTEFIKGLYPPENDKLNIVAFDKRYTVSFQNRNDKNAEHLLITNYRLEGERE